MSTQEQRGVAWEWLSIAPFAVLAFVCIYVSLMIGEFVGNTSWFLHLRSDVGVPITLLRVAVLSITVLPAAYLAGSWLIRRSPIQGRKAILGAAILFASIIAVLQVVHYEWDVWSASLLKVAFAVSGLWLAYSLNQLPHPSEGQTHGGDPQNDT